MFLIIPSAALVIYAICSGLIPLHFSISWKLFFSLLIVLAGLKYQFYLLGGGSLLSPGVSRETMLVLEALYGALVVFVFFLILKDLATLALWLLKKMGTAVPFSFNKVPVIFGMMGLSLILGAYGVHEAIKVPKVMATDIKIKNLPAPWKDMKIVQLSDLHVGPIQGKEWVQKIVDKANAIKPDLIVITGDFIDGPVSKLLPELEPLKQLKARYGVMAIPGNHEYYSGYSSWMKALQGLGINMLQNESITLKKDGAFLTIGGTTDYGASRFNMTPPDLKKTFAGSPETSTRILLTHQPKTTHRSKERFELQLSGHTHGGHLIFLYPLIGVFNDGLVLGLYQRQDRLIYVNRGTGLWNGFSMRLGVPSEITEITLK